MKMQNIEMEFVTFGAGDVIATSGFNWAGLNMCAGQGTIVSYNKTFGDLTGIRLGNTSETATQQPVDKWKVFGYLPGSVTKKSGFNRAKGMKEGTNHSIPFPADPFEELSLPNVGNASLSKKYTYAATANDIYDWLVANNLYVQ